MEPSLGMDVGHFSMVIMLVITRRVSLSGCREL